MFSFLNIQTFTKRLLLYKIVHSKNVIYQILKTQQCYKVNFEAGNLLELTGKET